MFVITKARYRLKKSDRNMEVRKYTANLNNMQLARKEREKISILGKRGRLMNRALEMWIAFIECIGKKILGIILRMAMW